MRSTLRKLAKRLPHAAVALTLPFSLVASVGDAFAAGYSDAVASTSGLKSYWKLAETSGTIARDTQGVRNGAYVGGVSLGQSGATGDAGTSAGFDGVNDHVDFGDTYDHAANAPFTIQAWVRPSATGAASTWRRIVSKESTTGGYFLYLLPDSAGTDRAQRVGFERSSLSGKRVGTDSVRGTTALKAGVNYHVAVTYDGEQQRIYVNGKLEGQGSSGRSIPNHSGALRLGAASAGGGAYGGLIDDVAFYSAALSATTLEAHFAATTAAAPAPVPEPAPITSEPAPTASPAPPAPANEFHVAKGGSDANPGTSTAPWLTISKAAASAPAGSNVLVGAGTYAENVVSSRPGISFSRSGADAVSLTSWTINASQTSLTGFSIAGTASSCVTVAAGLADVKLIGNRISNCGVNGIRVSPPATATNGVAYTSQVSIRGNVVVGVGKVNAGGSAMRIHGNSVAVEDNDISDSPNDAIVMWGDRHTYRRNRIHDIANTAAHNDAFQTWTENAAGAPITNLLIEQNVVENVPGPNGHCLMASGVGHRSWTIRSNLFRSIGSACLIFGIQGEQGIQDVTVASNTFVSAGVNSTMTIDGGTTARAASNVFYNCSAPYFTRAGASLVSDYNLAGGTTPRLSESHGLNADPLFVNSASDFRLQAGSPARDSGDNGAVVNPVRPADLLGVAAVGTSDRGAYEFR